MSGAPWTNSTYSIAVLPGGLHDPVRPGVHLVEGVVVPVHADRAGVVVDLDAANRVRRIACARMNRAWRYAAALFWIANGREPLSRHAVLQGDRPAAVREPPAARSTSHLAWRSWSGGWRSCRRQRGRRRAGGCSGRWRPCTGPTSTWRCGRRSSRSSAAPAAVGAPAGAGPVRLAHLARDRVGRFELRHFATEGWPPNAVVRPARRVRARAALRPRAAGGPGRPA